MAKRNCQPPLDPMEFSGVNMDHLPLVEECFKLNIMVLEVFEDDSILPRYRTTSRHPDTIYLNLYEHHLSYILDFKAYAKKFRCSTCSRHFPQMSGLVKRMRVCLSVTKFKFPGGHYKASNTVFDEMEKLGIVVEEDRFFPWFAVYDFEAMLMDHENPDATGKLKWTHTHQPVSFSVSANVEGFRVPQCFVELEKDNLMSIRQDVMVKAKEKWSSPIEKLKVLKEKHRPIVEDNDGGEDDDDNSGEAVEVEGVDKPASDEMVRAMSKPNVGRSFFQGLANDEWGVTYNEFDDGGVDDDAVDDDDDNDDDDDEGNQGEDEEDAPPDDDECMPGDVKGLMYRMVQ